MNKTDEYQTPKKYVEAARLVMGKIDLDAASSEVNNERLKIPYFYSKKDLQGDRPLSGNVWLNPPYSKPNLTKFTNLILRDKLYFNQLIYLVPSYTSERWYHKCLTVASAFCLLDHRIEFLLNKKFQTSPRFANTFFYFGNNNTIKFCEVFKQFGFVQLTKKD